MYETLQARHELKPSQTRYSCNRFARIYGIYIHTLLQDHLARRLMHESTIVDFTFTSLIYATYRIHYNALNKGKQTPDMQKNTLTLHPYEHSLKNHAFFQSYFRCM
jgi:hypothetical protein